MCRVSQHKRLWSCVPSAIRRECEKTTAARRTRRNASNCSSLHGLRTRMNDPQGPFANDRPPGKSRFACVRHQFTVRSSRDQIRDARWHRQRRHSEAWPLEIEAESLSQVKPIPPCSGMPVLATFAVNVDAASTWPSKRERARHRPSSTAQAAYRSAPWNSRSAPACRGLCWNP